MSYSNDQVQIRQGLVNYIGALLKASPFSGKAARQGVASILIEESLKIAQDDEGLIDLYVAKPLLRATVHTLKQRCVELSKLPAPEAKKKIQDYEVAIRELEILINSIK